MRTRTRRLGQRLAVLGAATALTAALAQNPTTAAFTAQTGNGSNQAATASTFCPGASSQKVLVAADVAVYEVNKDQNYNTSAIGIGSHSSGDAHSFLKFTLPSAPARCTLTSATLHVYATSPMAGGTAYAYRADGPWDAATLRWSTVTRPAWAGTPASVALTGATGWLQWDVTTLTRELLVGPDYGFLLKDSVDHDPVSARYQTWDSMNSNAARSPYLMVYWG